MSNIQPLLDFLPCKTPDAWLDKALQHQEILLIDHANCEKKAASSALNMIYRYVDRYPLLQKMSRLAREELRHFEKVIAIMEKRGIHYQLLSAARYAKKLREMVRVQEPFKLIDSLIVGAIIEARSCERFYRLAPLLDAELQQFYQSLLNSEARHFMDYLHFAKDIAGEDLTARINEFLVVEEDLITSQDLGFRFHSGI